MADSDPQWHSRAAKAPSPPNPNSPLSPASGGNNPVSFQTNVNRAKTKRWVDAKQYSYDGGDWGDEDDNQEGPPAAPQPPYASHRPGSSSELSSRRLSGLPYGSDETRASPSAEAQRNSGGSDQKAPPFIRPADIYKRMRDERSSTGSGYSAEAPQSSAQPGGVTGSSDAAKPATTREPSLIGLPEVKRISAFGTDFLSGGDSSFQPKTSSESQQTSLQHNPSEASSHGFRSVVHQAFDVPETPNSTAGSVGRSNSDGTSSVSPIMSNRGWTDDKTPTIPEEPAESDTPTGATAEPASLKRGHRRDISLPIPDNSPSKRPMVNDHTVPASDHAEVSSVSTVQPVDADSSSQRTMKPSTSAEKDFVAPLKFGSNGGAGAEGYRGDIPTIAPAGHSPQDADNDRLREEIIQSLSREGSQEPEHQPQSQGATEDSIPRQYEKFWGDGAGHSVPDRHEGSNVLVSESHPHWTSSHSLASQDPYAVNQAASGEAPPVAAEPPTKPRMARRFSWESSSSEEEPQLPGNFSSPPPLGAALAIQEPEPIPDDSTQTALTGASREPPMADDEVSDNQKPEKPKLSIVPPVAENGNPPEHVAGPADIPTSQGAPMPANVGTLDIDESKLKGFREILNITAPGERIRAFDHTRDQFAALNTGLNHWLEFTVHDHPDHTDLVQATQSLSADFARSSPTSRRFPKLTSFGNLASKDENAPVSAGHNRRPSGHAGTIVSRQNVEQRGKDFLHTAGAFSGKAGVAAKGLFAKGRSKFRPSGDKGQSKSFRKSLQVQGFSSESNASFSNTVSFGGLPVSKHDRNVSSPAVLPDARDTGDGEPPGKRSKYSGSLDPLQTRENVNDGAIDRRASQGFAGRSHTAQDFEREMNAALGLSPTEPRPQHQTNDKTASNDPPVAEKSLPLLPGRPSDGPVPAPSSSLDLKTSETTTSTVRPVSREEVKPSTPPKDLPPRTPPPEVPPKDLPSKDLPPRDNSLKSLLNQDLKPLPQSSHSQRQPSVSTLGADERMASRPAEGEVETPPSPIQLATKEAGNPVYVKSLPLAAASGTSLPSVEENIAGFTPMSPRRQSSAQFLDSKRRSISGMPGVQSPLRNEVRYSPGTRSSMMSWSSFGRRSTNSKSTRPGTPANELSNGVARMVSNGDSKMDKLKNFGKRRRASMGGILSGMQENIQGGLQGIPEGSKRKRTFSRISGFFNRSHESQHAESKQDGRSRTNGQLSESKALSNPPFDGYTQSSAAQHGRLNANGASAGKALPAMPALESQSTSVAPSFARDPRQRASMPLPPSASSPSLASGRFYHQVLSTDTPSAAQHTRVQSQPMMPAAPLSPIAQSVSDKSGSPFPSHA